MKKKRKSHEGKFIISRCDFVENAKFNLIFQIQKNPAIAHFKGPIDFMPY